MAEETKQIYCKCGAYLGKVVPGYVKTVQCFCGEVMPIEIEERFETVSQPMPNF